MNNKAILDSISSEVENFLQSDPAGLDLETMENDVRELLKGLGQQIFQRRLEQRIELCRGGYLGQSQVLEGGQTAFFERYEDRSLQSYFGKVKFRRAYYWIPGENERSGFVPLDMELGLNSHATTPALQKGLTALGVEAPFAKAGRLLTEIAMITVTPRTIEDVAEHAGRDVRTDMHEQQAKAWSVFDGPSCHTSKQKKGSVSGTLDEWASVPAPERLYLQMDGGRLNTTQGWKEPKVAVFFNGADVAEVSRERGEIIKKEYVASMADLDGFEKYIWEAGLRWGAPCAKEMIFLGDGAKGFQNRVGQLFPEAIQILDWYHAAEHLWELGRILHGMGTKKLKKWATPLLDLLWEGQVDAVLSKLRRMKPRRSEAKKCLRELIVYYKRNRQRMRYGKFRKKGYFIGSGAIESGVKNVVNVRMKGCGMRWNLDRADQLIHARAKYAIRHEDGCRPKAYRHDVAVGLGSVNVRQCHTMFFARSRWCPSPCKRVLCLLYCCYNNGVTEV